MPTLAVTLGDPAGIGPEVTAAALAGWLKPAPGVRIVLCGPANLVEPMATRLNVLAHGQAVFAGPMGVPSADSGRAALAALHAAISLAQQGQAQGIVTAPISKQALTMAGSADHGHTEILARSLANGPVAMSFFSERLRVALATNHLALERVPKVLTSGRVVEVAVLLRDALRSLFGAPSPRLALAALNPHAGEAGLFGDEEVRILAPAVREARARGITLSDPLPADTVFRRARDGEFDGVVALYHDQGLIPVKLVEVGEAVHATLGLRVPRTSPDHGTAYDRAGLGTARPQGMVAALELMARWVALPAGKSSA